MKTLSFYEQCGILLPGSLFLLGLVLLLPSISPILSPAGITVGGLGLFLIVAYTLGHAIAAVGNLLESAFWAIRGGMPSDWFFSKPTRLLSDERARAVRAQITSRLGASATEVEQFTAKGWKSMFAQLYRDVLANNPGRVETFNGNYGLCRGLAAAILALIPLALMYAPFEHRTALLAWMAGGVVVFIFRMNRFGVHFAREVFFNFLNLPPGRAATPTGSQSHAR